MIGTYHAYAGRLVGDNALREGLEPSMRLITPALSWQLAAQIVAAYDGPMDEITWTPQTVTAAVLELAGDLAEHLREHGDVTARGPLAHAEHDALPGRITPGRSEDNCHPAGPGAAAAAGQPVRGGQGGAARCSTTPTRWRWRRGSPPGTRRSGGRACALPGGPAR